MLKRNLIFAATLAMSLSPLAWAVGTIDFVAGNVAINNYKNELRLPALNDRIEVGDTLVTGSDGEVHVRTDDQGLLVLRPQSQLQVDTYRAQGRSSDEAVYRLIRGGFRSVAGWIGRDDGDHLRVVTTSGTLVLRGADHEPYVRENGADAGTYDKVNQGSATLTSELGSVNIAAGRAGFAPYGAKQAPATLGSIPGFIQAAPGERSLAAQIAELDQAREKARQQSGRSTAGKGGGVNEAPKLGDLQDQRNALAALEDLFRQYEAGNINYLRSRLEPSMIGFQQIMDRMTAEVFQCKQMRIRLLDTQVQAGPDLAVIQSGWEKRCLMLPNFTPKIDSGIASFLMHKGKNGWGMASLSGNNPFERTATVATLNVTGGMNCASLGNGTFLAPINITLTDPDLAGVGGASVTVTTAQGESEVIPLLPLGGGVFVKQGLSITPSSPVGNNGIVEVLPIGALISPSCPSLTITYTDSTTPNNVPQLVQTSVRLP